MPMTANRTTSRKSRHLLAKHRLVEDLVHRQEMPRHDLVESLVHNQTSGRTAQPARPPADGRGCQHPRSAARKKIACSPGTRLPRNAATRFSNCFPTTVREDLVGDASPQQRPKHASTPSSCTMAACARSPSTAATTSPTSSRSGSTWWRRRRRCANGSASISASNCRIRTDLTDLEASARFYVEDNGEVHLHSDFLLDTRGGIAQRRGRLHPAPGHPVLGAQRGTAGLPPAAAARPHPARLRHRRQGRAARPLCRRCRVFRRRAGGRLCRTGGGRQAGAEPAGDRRGSRARSCPTSPARKT